MRSSGNRSFKLITGIASVTLLGMASALLLFNIMPRQDIGTGPSKAIAILKPTTTPEAIKPQEADCVGGTTTLVEGRKHAGFNMLEPGYVPDSLQLSAVILNRLFAQPGFQAILYYRNLVRNAAEPYVRIDQRLAPPNDEPIGPDQRISPITIRGIRGQLIEFVEPKSTPLPPGTPMPNPTLTAFASGRITIIPQTPRPLATCTWTFIATPVPWTPTPVRTLSARPVTATPTPTTWHPPPMLRWIENGVQIAVYGTYSHEELLEVAESLR